MDNLGSPNIASVRVLHQSIVFLLFRGAIVGVLALITFLLLDLFFSATHTMPTYSSWENSTPSSSGSSLWAHVSSAELWAQVITIFVLVGFIGYMVLQWIYNYYIIEPHHIIMRQGIFFSIEDRFNMEAMQKIEVRQNIFGKIFNYGTIDLFNPEFEKRILLQRIPDPYGEANFIKQFCPTPNLVRGIIKA